MRKFLGKVSIYLVLIFVLGNSSAFIAGYFLSRSYFYKPDFIVNRLGDGMHFNYVIAGSSRGLTTIATETIDRKLGIQGLNLSMDDTGLPSQFLMIKHYFESGNSADYCILTLDLGHFEASEKKLNDNDYRFISYSGRPYVKSYFKSNETGLIKPLTISSTFPIFAFAYYNLELFWPAGVAAVKPTYSNRFDLNGNYSYPDNTVSLDSTQLTWETIQTSFKNPILGELSSYLKNKNCQLIIYVAPYFGKEIIVESTSNYPLINHSGTLRCSNYFFDFDHVNNRGKIMATNLFIEAIQEYF